VAHVKKWHLFVTFTYNLSHPELTGHASLFYDARKALKNDSSSRVVMIQREITERTIELLKLEGGRPSLVLDVRCGSRLSGEVHLKCCDFGLF